MVVPRWWYPGSVPCHTTPPWVHTAVHRPSRWRSCWQPGPGPEAPLTHPVTEVTVTDTGVTVTTPASLLVFLGFPALKNGPPGPEDASQVQEGPRDHSCHLPPFCAFCHFWSFWASSRVVPGPIWAHTGGEREFSLSEELNSESPESHSSYLIAQNGELTPEESEGYSCRDQAGLTGPEGGLLSPALLRCQ